jgi:WD40 repeat protein
MDLLAGDHRTLFGAAVERLARERAASRPLLEALALARGRGLPRSRDVWLTVARSLTELVIDDDDIDWLLRAAAPYVMLDAEHDQSVYRLAHRTFAEHFETDAAKVDLHRRVSRALVSATSHALPATPSPYVVFHLASHAAEAHAWSDLARAADVLDHLNPSSVAAEVLRTTLGLADVPTEVAAFLGAHHLLGLVPPRDRVTVRAVAMARLTGVPEQPDSRSNAADAAIEWFARPPENGRPTYSHRNTYNDRTTGSAKRPSEYWAYSGSIFVAHAHYLGQPSAPSGGTTGAGGVRSTEAAPTTPTGALRWARLHHQAMHVIVPAHTGPAHSVTAVPLPDGRTLLASGGDDTTVRLWDPLTARPASDPLTGHTGPVRALAAVPLPDGRTLLASSGETDSIFDKEMMRVWDPLTGEPLVGPTGLTSEMNSFFQTTGLAPVPLLDTRTLLATTGTFVGYQLRLWDAATDRWQHYSLPSVFEEVKLSAVAPLPDGRILLATSGERTIKVWEVPDRDGDAGSWKYMDLRPLGTPIVDPAESVLAIATVPIADRRTLLASAGSDGAVRLWNPVVETGTENHTSQDDSAPAANADADQPAAPLCPSGPGLAVTSVRALPLADGRTLLATGNRDELIRLWNPASGAVVGQPLATQRGRTRWFTDTATVAAVPLPDGRTLLATGSGRTVRLWDPDTGDSLDWPRFTSWIPLIPWGRAIAWNRRLLSLSAVGAVAPITAMTTVRLPDHSTLLAVGSGRTVLMWNITANRLLRYKQHVQTRHSAPVRAIAAVSLPEDRTLLASAGDDEVIRLSDPRTGRATTELRGHDGPVRALTAVPSPSGGTLLVSGGDDQTVRLWDPATSRAMGDPLIGHTGPVRALATVPLPGRGTLLASGGDDETVRLWDPATNSLKLTILLGVPVSSMAIAGGALCAGSAIGLLALDTEFIDKNT